MRASNRPLCSFFFSAAGAALGASAAGMAEGFVRAGTGSASGGGSFTFGIGITRERSGAAVLRSTGCCRMGRWIGRGSGGFGGSITAIGTGASSFGSGTAITGNGANRAAVESTRSRTCSTGAFADPRVVNSSRAV